MKENRKKDRKTMQEIAHSWTIGFFIAVMYVLPVCTMPNDYFGMFYFTSSV